MITENIQLILLASGIATMGAFLIFLAPHLALKHAFNSESCDGATVLLARHWGLLIFLVGALLVYSAYNPAVRDPVLVIAGLEKTVFSLLVFFGPATRTPIATALAIGDASFVLLYGLHFMGF